MNSSSVSSGEEDDDFGSVENNVMHQIGVHFPEFIEKPEFREILGSDLYDVLLSQQQSPLPRSNGIVRLKTLTNLVRDEAENAAINRNRIEAK